MFCSILVPGEQFPQKALLYCLFSVSARHSELNPESVLYFSALAKQTDCVGTQSCVSTGSAMAMHLPYHTTELV